jgi:hypothetical protein
MLQATQPEGILRSSARPKTGQACRILNHRLDQGQDSPKLLAILQPQQVPELRPMLLFLAIVKLRRRDAQLLTDREDV